MRQPVSAAARIISGLSNARIISGYNFKLGPVDVSIIIGLADMLVSGIQSKLKHLANLRGQAFVVVWRIKFNVMREIYFAFPAPDKKSYINLVRIASEIRSVPRRKERLDSVVLARQMRIQLVSRVAEFPASDDGQEAFAH